MTFEPEVSFASLAECFEYLRSEFPDPTTRSSLEIKDGLARPTEPYAPLYLFRGENMAYETTLPMLHRLRAGVLDTDTLRAVEDASSALVARMVEMFARLPEADRPDAALCGSYAQHYGLPTGRFDFTDSAKVASFFAAWHGPVTQAIRDDGAGLICVASIKSLREAGTVESILDHPFAWRPRAQHAYTVGFDEHSDLKDPATIDELGLRWFGFRVTRKDREDFGSMTYLLETHIDPVGSMLCTVMNDHFLEKGPLPEEAATWIAEHIPPLWATMTPTDDGYLVPVTPGEAGWVYIEAKVRKAMAEVWSGKTLPHA